MKTKTQYHIRWMIRRDMNEVLDIEKGSFEVPWTENEFMIYLRKRNTIGMVVEHKERIIGFMIYELQRNELNLINFAVHPDYRQRGVATAMVEKLQDKLQPSRRTKIDIHIRETNLAAQLFFKSMGFLATKVVQGYFEDYDEDAYLMEYYL